MRRRVGAGREFEDQPPTLSVAIWDLGAWTWKALAT